MLFQVLTFSNPVLSHTVYQENSGFLSHRSFPDSGFSLSPPPVFSEKKIGKSPTRFSVESTASERPVSETVFSVQWGGTVIFREFLLTTVP